MKLLNLNQSICLVDLAVPHYPPKKLTLRLDDAASGKLATSLNNNILKTEIIVTYLRTLTIRPV